MSTHEVAIPAMSRFDLDHIESTLHPIRGHFLHAHLPSGTATPAFLAMASPAIASKEEPINYPNSSRSMGDRTPKTVGDLREEEGHKAQFPHGY
jgi:hypothetical protein